MIDKYKVVKIRPGWEHALTDDKGNMLFEFTSVPKNGMERRKRVSKKIMKELEARMKL